MSQELSVEVGCQVMVEQPRDRLGSRFEGDFQATSRLRSRRTMLACARLRRTLVPFARLRRDPCPGSRLDDQRLELERQARPVAHLRVRRQAQHQLAAVRGQGDRRCAVLGAPDVRSIDDVAARNLEHRQSGAGLLDPGRQHAAGVTVHPPRKRRGRRSRPRRYRPLEPSIWPAAIVALRDSMTKASMGSHS